MARGPWRLSLNAGMVAAGVLLAVGMALYFTAGEEGGTRQTAGLVLALVAAVLYIASRFVMVFWGKNP